VLLNALRVSPIRSASRRGVAGGAGASTEVNIRIKQDLGARIQDSGRTADN
jgi:hypothetical protein